MHYTVFGSTGRIGSYLTKFLIFEGHIVNTPKREEYYNLKNNLGQVIYCNGVTKNFKSRPFDTIQSHVCLLLHLLNENNFESFNYLSSTRLTFPKKSKIIKFGPDIYGDYEIDIYNASKLAGETLCIESNLPNVKVSRICHVVDPNDKKRENFLSNICGQAKNGKINIDSTFESKRNYILIDDLAFLLKVIGPFGKKKFYTIGSKNLISNNEILTKLIKLTGCTVKFNTDAQTVLEPEIRISNLIQEFNYNPTHKTVWLDSILKKLVS